MFGASPIRIDLPTRHRGSDLLSASTHRRGFTRKRHPSSASARAATNMYDADTPPLAARELWQRHQAALAGGVGDPFAEYGMADHPGAMPMHLSRSLSADGMGMSMGPGFRSGNSSSSRANWLQHQQRHRPSSASQQQMPPRAQPFDAAAHTLFTALERANTECQRLETCFAAELAGLARWLPSRHVEALWTLRLDWDGIPQRTSTVLLGSGRDASKDPVQTAGHQGNEIPFASVAKGLLEAIEGLQNSAPPDARALETCETPGVTVKTTMRKLEISLEAVEELVGMVRGQRGRMPALIREVIAAMVLLEGVKELWEGRPGRSGIGGGVGGGRSGGGRGYEWPGYGGKEV